MAIYMWRERVMPDYPCFTAISSWSVQLVKSWSPTNITIETSTDGLNWSTYTFWTAISLPNVWDKVYFRNTSETDTGFTTDRQNYYRFSQVGIDYSTIAVSWDFGYLLNKNWTTIASTQCFRQLFYNNVNIWEVSIKLPTTLADYCYVWMFQYCTWLVTANMELPATTLTTYWYGSMFEQCSNLTNLIKLPALNLVSSCYSNMYRDCPKIKLSATQTWEYQTAYRIPTTWTGTWTPEDCAKYMFYGTWWSWTWPAAYPWTPSINTTYYTSNTVV